MDVEKTIEFILEQQAQMQAEMHAGMANLRAALAERDAIGRRTDARLDRAIKLAAEEMRRERAQRRGLREEMERLAEAQRVTHEELQDLKRTVDRYIQARGNGQN